MNDQWVAKENVVKEKKVTVKELESEYNVQKSKVGTFEKKLNTFKVILALMLLYCSKRDLLFRTKSMIPKLSSMRWSPMFVTMKGN